MAPRGLFHTMYDAGKMFPFLSDVAASFINATHELGDDRDGGGGIRLHAFSPSVEEWTCAASAQHTTRQTLLRYGRTVDGGVG